MSDPIYKPIDANGADLKVGDWIKVVSIPASIRSMPKETAAAFEKAVGHTLQILDFDCSGCVELDFYPKLGLDTIWLEPSCCVRFRRYKRFSQNLQRILRTRRS